MKILFFLSLVIISLAATINGFDNISDPSLSRQNSSIQLNVENSNETAITIDISTTKINKRSYSYDDLEALRHAPPIAHQTISIIDPIEAILIVPYEDRAASRRLTYINTTPVNDSNSQEVIREISQNNQRETVIDDEEVLRRRYENTRVNTRRLARRYENRRHPIRRDRRSDDSDEDNCYDHYQTCLLFLCFPCTSIIEYCFF